MEKKYADIINEGKKQGATVEAINAELKAAGANFHLNPDGGVAGWTQAEMGEGFIPSKEEVKDVVHLIDLMKFNLNMAGKTKEYWTAEGKYEITWNENGNPVKAIRKN